MVALFIVMNSGVEQNCCLDEIWLTLKKSFWYNENKEVI